MCPYMGAAQKKLVVTPSKLEWLGEALKLSDVLSDESALEAALESFPVISLELWQAGQNVLQEGVPGDDFFVVFSGKLSAWRGPAGEPSRRLGTLKPGDFFGEIGFLLKSVRAATVRADVECKIFRFPATELAVLLRKHKALSQWIRRVAVKRLSRIFEDR